MNNQLDNNNPQANGAEDWPTYIAKEDVACLRANADPLLGWASAAAYLNFASAGSLKTAYYRRTYPFLNANVVYIGRRAFFKRSTLDAFIASCTGARKGRAK